MNPESDSAPVAPAPVTKNPLKFTDIHLLPASVETLRAFGPDVYILALAASFPCLADRWQNGIGKKWGTDRTGFDIDKWLKAARPWCHGEKCAAYFVATVWNYSSAKGKKWKFDYVDAASVMSARNLAVINNWGASPVWP